jgi:hypothetical protein
VEDALDRGAAHVHTCDATSTGYDQQYQAANPGTYGVGTKRTKRLARKCNAFIAFWGKKRARFRRIRHSGSSGDEWRLREVRRRAGVCGYVNGTMLNPKAGFERVERRNAKANSNARRFRGCVELARLHVEPDAIHGGDTTQKYSTADRTAASGIWWQLGCKHKRCLHGEMSVCTHSRIRRDASVAMTRACTLKC